MKNISIIGSSGSIGRQTLNVIRRNPDEFRVKALVVNKNTQQLHRQLQEFKPDYAGIVDEKEYRDFVFPDGVKPLRGKDALEVAAEIDDADIVVISVSGIAGLFPLIKAISANKVIALANKESIVCAGEIINELLKKSKARIIPVDSEHSAVFQCLESAGRRELSRIILTASGGPFFGKKSADLKNITPEKAIRHPRWNMGKKISVDSATMVNKGLEIIEAARLFDVENVDYVIHPQSIVHSMVEFVDGVVIAQMAQTDMELPIQYALTYPKRLPVEDKKLRFDFSLDFLPPDEVNFPAPKIAKQCLKAGGIMPCVYSVADEIAVDLFLQNKISFDEIVPIIQKTLDETENLTLFGLTEIIDTYNNLTRKIRKEYLH